MADAQVVQLEAATISELASSLSAAQRNRIPQFEGRKDDDFLSWLEKYETNARFCRWDEALCCHQLPGFLSGTAYDYYSQEILGTPTADSWPDLCLHLKSFFLPVNHKFIARDQLYKRIQRPGEEAKDFIIAVKRLAARVKDNMDFDDLAYVIIRGLRSDLRSLLLRRDLPDIQTLTKEARLIEATLDPLPVLHESASAFALSAHSAPHDSSVSQPAAVNQRPPPKQRVTCFYCKLGGHTKAACHVRQLDEKNDRLQKREKETSGFSSGSDCSSGTTSFRSRSHSITNPYRRRFRSSCSTNNNCLNILPEHRAKRKCYGIRQIRLEADARASRQSKEAMSFYSLNHNPLTHSPDSRLSASPILSLSRSASPTMNHLQSLSVPFGSWRPCVGVKLFDHQTTALLDSGANATFISTRLAQRLPALIDQLLSPYDQTVVLGDSRPHAGIIGSKELTVTLTINSVLRTVSVKGIIADHLDNDLILGTDALALLGVVIDFRRREIRMPTPGANPAAIASPPPSQRCFYCQLQGHRKAACHVRQNDERHGIFRRNNTEEPNSGARPRTSFPEEARTWRNTMPEQAGPSGQSTSQQSGYISPVLQYHAMLDGEGGGSPHSYPNSE